MNLKLQPSLASYTPSARRRVTADFTSAHYSELMALLYALGRQLSLPGAVVN